MKYFLVLLFFPFSANAQIEPSNDKIEYQARRDSILVQTEFGSIYYTHDTTAVSYDYLNPTQIDSTIFTQFYREMQLELEGKFSIQTKHFKHPFINSHWTNLYQFNNAFCLYGPSDWMAHTELFFTDSLLYNLRSDGDLEFIMSVSTISSNACEFELLNYLNEPYFLAIRIVDENRGIATFEWYDDKHVSYHKSVYVKSEMVRNFPILIYDCGNQKCAFGDVNFFEPIDFSDY